MNTEGKKKRKSFDILRKREEKEFQQKEKEHHHRKEGIEDRRFSDTDLHIFSENIHKFNSVSSC